MENRMAKLDDLEAVRAVVSALSGFSPEEQERVIRWSREKLGLTSPPRDITQMAKPLSLAQVTPSLSEGRAPSALTPSTSKDLKSFVEAKAPKSDVQFAATVAYFYRFEAPVEERKNEIDASILQDACRLAGRARFKDPPVTLNNAKKLGLLDAERRGKYAINSVGENLVAMTLPGQSDATARRRTNKKSTKKRPAKKQK
jgi:hypothetical protein